MADGLLQSWLSTALDLLRVELKLVALAKTFHVLFSHGHLGDLAPESPVELRLQAQCPCWSTKLRYHVETRGTATGRRTSGQDYTQPSQHEVRTLFTALFTASRAPLVLSQCEHGSPASNTVCQTWENKGTSGFSHGTSTPQHCGSVPSTSLVLC